MEMDREEGMRRTEQSPEAADVLRILILEDFEPDAELVARELRKAGIACMLRRVETEHEFRRGINEFQPSLILADYSLPAFDGLSALEIANAECPEIPFVFVSGTIGEEVAIETLKRGATDYVLKERLSRLVPAVRRSLQEVEERRARRRAQRALRESEARYRAIFETTGVPSMLVEADTTISLVNTEFTLMTGYAKEEVEGRISVLDFIHPEDREMVLNYHRQRRLDPRSVPAKYEVRGITRTGEVRDLYLTVSLIPGTHITVASFLDITERKQSEDRMRKLLQVFDQASEGMVITNASGQVEWVNRAFSRILGYRPEDIIGRPSPPLIETEQDEVRAAIQASLRELGYWEGETRGRRRNGTRFPLWESVSAVQDDAGEFKGYIGIFRDMTEQKRMEEEQRRLREQAERGRRLATLSAMSAGIVHEIAQPLNAIKVLAEGMLYWQRQGVQPPMSEVIETLEEISSEACRIAEIMNHVRSLVSRGQPAGQRRCDLNRAVREALALLGSQMAARGIRVSTRLDHQLPEVMGNERGMEEIAINLLVNAMQAFDESTRTEREVVITTRREGGWVVMEVADNATGIEEEAKEHLFEPFTTTKLHSEGMGLGLTIVQSIVSGSGGNVDVRNNEWGGATFRIELPALGPEKE